MMMRAVYKDWSESLARQGSPLHPSYGDTYEEFVARIAQLGVESSKYGGCLHPEMLPWGGAFGNHWGI